MRIPAESGKPVTVKNPYQQTLERLVPLLEHFERRMCVKHEEKQGYMGFFGADSTEAISDLHSIGIEGDRSLRRNPVNTDQIAGRLRDFYEKVPLLVNRVNVYESILTVRMQQSLRISSLIGT